MKGEADLQFRCIIQLLQYKFIRNWNKNFAFTPFPSIAWEEEVVAYPAPLKWQYLEYFQDMEDTVR